MTRHIKCNTSTCHGTGRCCVSGGKHMKQQEIEQMSHGMWQVLRKIAKQKVTRVRENDKLQGTKGCKYGEWHKDHPKNRGKKDEK